MSMTTPVASTPVYEEHFYFMNRFLYKLICVQRPPSVVAAHDSFHLYTARMYTVLYGTAYTMQAPTLTVTASSASWLC